MSTPTDPDSPHRRKKLSHASTSGSNRPAKTNAKVLLYPVAQSEIPALAMLYMKAYRGMEEYGEASTDQAVLYLQNIYRFCAKGFFKAVVDGRAAGFIVCDPDWCEPGQRKVLEVHEVVVDPDFQGYGLGGLFMRFAGAMGRKHGRSEVSLWAGEGNRKAINWYTGKFGFREGRRDGVWVHYQSCIESVLGQQ